MSIQSEIERILANVAEAYSVLSAKGATMPDTQNTENLAETIESLEMVEAEAMSIETIREICGYGWKSWLPEGYTLLEYIESSGTQYIDTGFIPNQDTRFVMDAQITDTATRHLFGARTAATSNMFFAACLSATTVRADYGTKQNKHTVTSVLDRMTWDVSKAGCTIGNTSSTFTAATFSPNVPMALFASNTNGTIVADTYKAKMKLYCCQIYDNGTLTRDFVPCINPDGEYGLYDKVNEQFYGNAGSSSFTGA